jgi:hypothetical protein
VKHTTTPVVKATGILAFALIIGAINSLFFPSDMGFLAGFFNPYTAVSLFIAVY